MMRRVAAGGGDRARVGGSVAGGRAGPAAEPDRGHDVRVLGRLGVRLPRGAGRRRRPPCRGRPGAAGAPTRSATPRRPPDATEIAVVARRADGSLDTSFAGDGSLALPITAGQHAHGADIAVLPDGRLRILGTTDVDPGSGEDDDIVLVGLLADGTPDPDFGTVTLRRRSATTSRAVWRSTAPGGSRSPVAPATTRSSPCGPSTARRTGRSPCSTAARAATTPAWTSPGAPPARSR